MSLAFGTHHKSVDIQTAAVNACDHDGDLLGDPWKGNEDLAREGLLEWFADCKQLGHAKSPEEVLAYERVFLEDVSWQAVSSNSSFFATPNPIVDNVRKLSEEEVFEKIRMSSRHRDQPRCMPSPWQVTRRTSDQAITYREDSYGRSPSKSVSRRSSSARYSSSSCSPKVSTGPQRGSEAGHLSISSISTKSSVSGVTSQRQAWGKVIQGLRNSGDARQAGLVPCSSKERLIRPQLLATVPVDDDPPGMSVEDWRAYHTACQNQLFNSAQAIAESRGCKGCKEGSCSLPTKCLD